MTRRLALALALMLMSSGAKAESNDDVGRTMLARIATAWSTADAGAIAALYAKDGDLMIPSGTRLAGRDAIRAFYTEAFKRGYGGSRASAELETIRGPAPNLLLGDGVWAIEGAIRPDGSPRPKEQGRFTVVLRRDAAGTDWKIAALREYVPTR